MSSPRSRRRTAALFAIPLGAWAIGAGVLGAMAIVLWWLFFSRAPWTERLGVMLLIAVAMFATSQLAHPSIRGGYQGMMLMVYGAPVIALALVAGAATGGLFARGSRRAVMAASILVACRRVHADSHGWRVWRRRGSALAMDANR